jgi:hypothetical protein
MDSRVVAIFDQQSAMESERATWETHWREIAERVLPRQDDFQHVNRVGGEKRTEKRVDATAVLALDRAASASDSLLTPATQQWHGLEPEDPNLRDDPTVMAYLEEVTKLLFRVRYRPTANFASQAHETYISLMAFGTQGMFVDDIIGIGIRYKSCALAELYITENHVGIVDYIHRKFPLTARAALQKWGDRLPESIRKVAEKEPLRKFDFIHCVKPNEDVKYGKADRGGMALASYYVSCEGKHLLSEGGYRTMPYLVSRHVTAPRETYGRSPAMQVLPDIKMLNEMEKTIVRAAHKIVDPPLLAHGDGVLNAFSVRPNAINYGGVDHNGNALVQPLKTGTNLPIGLEISEQKRKLINDAFYVTLFQILVENPRMTATEALIRAQEKGQLLAPTVGRQQSEFLGPMIERELDILNMAGILPEMPEALKRSGGAIKAVYTSPLTRLRRAEDGVAILRTIEALTPIATAKPQVFDVFEDIELALELADINGVPRKVLKTRKAMAEKQAVDAENAQRQQDVDAAAAASAAAKNLGQAAQAASFVAPAEVPQP